MIRCHYLRRWPGVVTQVQLLLCNRAAVGLIVFALPPRETDVRYGKKCWELARLWVDDSMPRNSESWFVTRAIEHLPVDVHMLVSYADPSAGHEGKIYRACNWTRDGMTDEGRTTPRCDYVHPVTGKHYSRAAHVPDGVNVIRVSRVSKFRYTLDVSARRRIDLAERQGRLPI